jgi:hypothetical protein
MILFETGPVPMAGLLEFLSVDRFWGGVRSDLALGALPPLRYLRMVSEGEKCLVNTEERILCTVILNSSVGQGVWS